MKKALVYTITILIGILIFRQLNFTDEKNTIKVLQMAGHSNIMVGGYDWFKCPTEMKATKFKSIGPSGKLAKGTVCTSIIISRSTIKYEAE